VYSWEHIPDLLFLNPYAYFVRQPEIESTWDENIDPSDPVRAVSESSDVDPIPLEHVLRRSELNFNLRNYIRAIMMIRRVARCCPRLNVR
jgi:hypothetical protein